MKVEGRLAEMFFMELHLDRLNWRKYISTKRKQLKLQLRKMYWLFGSKSRQQSEVDVTLSTSPYR